MISKYLLQVAAGIYSLIRHQKSERCTVHLLRRRDVKDEDGAEKVDGNQCVCSNLIRRVDVMPPKQYAVSRITMDMDTSSNTNDNKSANSSSKKNFSEIIEFITAVQFTS